MTSILIISPSLGHGGAERQLTELVKGLLGRGHHVEVLITQLVEGGYYEQIAAMGVKIHLIERRSKYDLSVILRVRQLIQSAEFDVIHPFLGMGSLIAVIAGLGLKVPIVASAIRDAKVPDIKIKVMSHVVARLADIVVSNSEAGFKSRFKRHGKNFRVIYNGVDFSRFKESPDDIARIRKELDLGRFEQLIGMVASLSDNKDHEALLRSFKVLKASRKGLGLIIVGGGPNRDKLERLAKELGVASDTVFTGHRSDVDQIYRCMDLVVLLTNSKKHAEGVPNALLEAMAVGVPVVGTRGGGTEELVTDGVNGKIIEPGSVSAAVDAILSTLDNYDPEMIERARESVRSRFSINTYIDEYINLYKSV
ncbi:glycosyltransferase [Oceanicoccus sagamiensis]|uniref:Uncharacterized protein n=1 Tax=Oceanicoccus sagamiensis TaxID=716816 RepID=A0A1X9N8U8_9GAMM|nr:glycosyltransferase [Oceanicoccus sagamiensis]ARN74096.1 hypothetical protein BST96_08150 [Oceanicoccus sagamiensis]